MNDNKIRIIFIGTADFGILSLSALIKDKQFDVAAVITQPDKKVGRKQIISPSPIKAEAKKHKIPVWQPKQISNFQFPIPDIDLIIVIAYAQLIPKTILSMPKYGCLNVHGSLLPKYRGAACIQAAILNNDQKTGVTIIKMDKGLDTGPILAQKTINIELTDIAGTLYKKLSFLAADLLIPTLRQYIDGKIKPEPQNEKQASFVRKLNKEDGHIDWSKSAKEIERFIRAMTPWPSAFSKIRNEKLEMKNYILFKILEVEHKPISINQFKIGELFLYNKNLAVQSKKNALIIKKLQLAGKKEHRSDVRVP
jgi:methionyl-tRNA formyltransferase